MALIELTAGANGRGRVRIDGVDMSSVVTSVHASVAADEHAVVTLALAGVDQDLSFGDAEVRIASTNLPETVQRALYEHLSARFSTSAP